MRRYIELLFYITFGAGMAFGTSSFTMLSGLFEMVTGLWVIISIVLAGIFCAVISTSIAELASMYPSSPGVRTYLKVAFNNQTSLLLVYLYLIFMVLIAAVESYMFALVVKAIFPHVPALAVVLGLIVFTIIINLLSLELPRGLQILTTLVLILTIAILGGYGFVNAPLKAGGSLAGAEDQLQQLKLLPAATGMAIYLFIGFEWVTMLGFSPESYKRRIPVSMPLAVLTNVVAYSLCVIGFSSQLTQEEIVAKSVPQVPYFTQLLGPWGNYVALGLSLLAVFSTFNAGVMGGSRLIYVLTREGNLPKWCAKMSLRTGAPIGGILVLGGFAILASIIVVQYELELLAAVIGSAIVCFVYAAFMLAVIRLRKTQPTVRRTFRTPLSLWIQWVIILLLPLLGATSLFSQPGMKYQPIVGTIIFVIIASLLVRWSLVRTREPAILTRM